MNACDLPVAVWPAGPLVSRVLRFVPAASPDEPHCWEGVPIAAYKLAADHHCGVTRSVLVGEQGEKTAFQVRYFEIAPGGFTTLEKHVHEHVVVVLRGRGEVRLGDQVHALGSGDTVYVAPEEIHQFHNLSASEPFGFLCLVDAVRDRPVPVLPR